MLPIVAIIGRPNVGKSTLFNRLAGKRLALVDDLPGVTRDRKEGVGHLGPLDFRLIDTAGLEQVTRKSPEMEKKMQEQTEAAAEDADLIYFVLDGRVDLQTEDKNFARWLRKKNKPVILVVNKCEGKGPFAGLEESYSLGFGEPVAVSAEHGEGLVELYDASEPHLAVKAAAAEETEPAVKEEELKITLLGRPNAGKSTLLNQLLGEERAITSKEAGTTRDAIYTHFTYEGTPLLLVDTAGIRKKAKISGRLEKMAVEDSLKAVQYSHVVVLMLDATHALEKQDLSLAGHVIEEGRGLVIAVNKWDLVADPKQLKKDIIEALHYQIPDAAAAPLVEISALKGKGLDQLMKSVFEVYQAWNRRITTSELNRWLKEAVDQYTPPLIGGRRLKLRYITQDKGRPPTFVLFCSNAKDFPQSYLRYLSNNLREVFGFVGCPLRILLRKRENPFASKRRKN
jgi:GTP-binding protein